MVMDLRRRPPGDNADQPPPPALGPQRRAGRWVPFVALASIVLATLAGWWLGIEDRPPAERVAAGGRALPAPAVRVLGNAQEASEPSATTAVDAPATTATVRPTTTVRSTSTPRAQAAAAPSPVTAATASAVTTSTAAPGTSTVAPATTAAPTTSTTVVSCRNSADPACGPFRFDPQPGPDNPMTVQVAVEPAAPTAGEQVTFRLTLTDPDGVSYNATTFGFGDGGVSGADYPPCERFGAWDPPARDPAAATTVQEVAHTYLSPGTYAVSFAFEAGPFSCVDSETGRGDRPYASSATGTATVVVG